MHAYLALMFINKLTAPHGPRLASSKSWRSLRGRGSSWRYHNHFDCEIEAPTADVMESFAIVAKKEMTEFIYASLQHYVGMQVADRSHSKYRGPIGKRTLIKNDKNNNNHNDC